MSQARNHAVERELFQVVLDLEEKAESIRGNLAIPTELGRKYADELIGIRNHVEALIRCLRDENVKGR